MTGDALSFGTFELSAPGMVDRIEMPAMASEAFGRTIGAGETSPEDLGVEFVHASRSDP